jgi:hypothetical protein
VKGAADEDERADALGPDDPDNYMTEADEGATSQESQRYSIEFPGSSGDVEKS